MSSILRGNNSVIGGNTTFSGPVTALSLNAPSYTATGAAGQYIMQDRANTSANTASLYYNAGQTRFYMNGADRAILDTSGNLMIYGTLKANVNIQFSVANTSAGVGGNTIIMDTSGSLIRFYEAGGSFRGVYVDLATAGSQGQIWHSNNFNPATYRKVASNTFVNIWKSTAQTLSAASFQKVNFDTANTNSVDLGGNWNTSTSVYTCPKTGIYHVSGFLRTPENLAVGTQLGIGIGTVAADGPTFKWSSSAGQRYTAHISRLDYRNAGDQLFMFAFVDTAMSVGSGSIQIVLVSE